MSYMSFQAFSENRQTPKSHMFHHIFSRHIAPKKIRGRLIHSSGAALLLLPPQGLQTHNLVGQKPVDKNHDFLAKKQPKNH